MAGHSVYGAQGSLAEVDGVHKHHIIVVVVLILQLRLLQNGRTETTSRSARVKQPRHFKQLPYQKLRLALLMRGNEGGDQAASFKKKFRGSGQQTQKLQVTEDDGDGPGTVRHHL